MGAGEAQAEVARPLLDPAADLEELEAQGFKNTGTPNVGGTIVTAGGLVFVGATNDSRFRAFDSRTGKELWWFNGGERVFASPITFLSRGRQMITIPIGDVLIAFGLD